MSDLVWALPAVISIAFLYGSVGHGGATGYIAVLTLLSFPFGEVSTTALTMNLLVSGAALWQFARAGEFDLKLIAPFLVTSVPAAYLGGAWRLSSDYLAVVLALVLSSAAAAMLLQVKQAPATAVRPPKPLVSLPVGGVLGFISGLIGIGGGVFLSPLLILFRFATVRQTAAASALFIFVNSASGIAARYFTGALTAGSTLWLLPAALAGGAFGARLGAFRFSNLGLKRLLAAVLLVAAVKALLFSA